MTPERRKYVIFGVVAAVAIVLDQWTKILARQHLKPLGYAGRKVIDGIFTLRYSENTGVAFGMLQSLTGGRIILTLVALAAFALVLYYLRKTDPDQRRFQVALGLVGGGAIGNLIDRIMLRRRHRLPGVRPGLLALQPLAGLQHRRRRPGGRRGADGHRHGPARSAGRDRQPPRRPRARADRAMALPARLLPLLARPAAGRRCWPPTSATKSWAESELRRRGARSLLGGHLVLRYQTNSGIAFGLFQQSLHPHKRPLLIAYSAVVSAGAGRGAGLAGCCAPAGPAGLADAGRAGGLAGGRGGQPARPDRAGGGDRLHRRAAVPGLACSWPAFNLADV